MKKKGLSPEIVETFEQQLLQLGTDVTKGDYKEGLAKIVIAFFAEAQDVNMVALLGNLARDPKEKSNQAELAAVALLIFPDRAITSKYWLGAHYLIDNLANVSLPGLADIVTQLQEIVDYN